MNYDKGETAKPPSGFAKPVGWICKTILGGLFVILPFVLIIGIVQYVYVLLNDYVIDPVGKLILPEQSEDSFLTYVAPLLSLAVVLACLFVMGLLFRTRLRNFVDWLMGNIPGVSTLYSAFSETFKAFEGSPGLKDVDTVVLVPFPQREMRMAGYLMTKSKQPNGRTLACVYIPIGVFPPSGYTIILPDEDVVYTNWPTKDVWKLLLSGGLTVPREIPFEPPEGAPVSPGVPRSSG